MKAFLAVSTTLAVCATLFAAARTADACQTGAPGCGGIPPLLVKIQPAAKFGTMIAHSSAAGSNDELWPASGLVSGGVYSSKSFPTAQNTRNTYAVTWPSGKMAASAVVLRARMSGGKPLGFPAAYNVYITNPQNTAWTLLGNFKTQPNAAGIATVAIANAPLTSGVMVVPTVLGIDNTNTHYLQLAGLEIAATSSITRTWAAGSAEPADITAGASFAASIGLSSANGLAGLSGGVIYASASSIQTTVTRNSDGSTTYSAPGFNLVPGYDVPPSSVTVPSSGNSIADQLGACAGTTVANGPPGHTTGLDPSTAAQTDQAARSAAAQNLNNGGDVDSAGDAAQDAINDSTLFGGGTYPPNGYFDDLSAALGSSLTDCLALF